MAMRAGLLRHPITIETPTEARDAMGGVTRTWANISTGASAWARIEPIRGNENLTEGQIRSGVSHKVTIRADSEVTALVRFKFVDAFSTTKYLYPVAPMLTDEINEQMVVMCTEHTDGAIED